MYLVLLVLSLSRVLSVKDLMTSVFCFCKENGDAKKVSAANMHASAGCMLLFFFLFLRSGFKDFLLKAELLRAIVDCGFEHPSEAWEELL